MGWFGGDDSELEEEPTPEGGAEPAPPGAPMPVTTTEIMSHGSGSTSTEKKVMPPDYAQAVSDYDKAQAAREDAGQKQIEAAKAIDQSNAQIAQQQADIARAREEEHRVREAEIEKLYQQRIAQHARDDEELAKAKPTDYWADKSPLQKFAAALSVGLGGFGASLNGGPNTAAQILQSGIEQHRALQREQLQAVLQRQQKAGADLNELIQMKERGLDRIDAEALRKYDDAQKIGAAIAAKVPTAQPAAEAALAENQKNSANLRAERAERAATVVRSMANYGSDKTTREVIPKGMAGAPTQLFGEGGVPIANVAPDKKSDLQKILKNYGNVLQALDNQEGSFRGGRASYGEKTHEREQLGAATTAALKDFLGVTRMAGGSLKMLEGIAPPTQWGYSDVLTNPKHEIAGAREFARSRMIRELDARGLPGAEIMERYDRSAAAARQQRAAAAGGEGHATTPAREEAPKRRTVDRATQTRAVAEAYDVIRDPNAPPERKEGARRALMSFGLPLTPPGMTK